MLLFTYHDYRSLQFEFVPVESWPAKNFKLQNDKKLSNKTRKKKEKGSKRLRKKNRNRFTEKKDKKKKEYE